MRSARWIATIRRIPRPAPPVADFRRRGGRSFPPRQTTRDWARSITTANVTVAAASKVLLVGFTGGGIDTTVRRVIGKLWVESDQHTVAETQVGALGGMVVSSIAFAAGAASIPGPFTERSEETWSLWVPFVMRSEGVADTGIGAHGLMFDFDSKAQRKLPGGSVYVLMIENAHASEGLECLLAVSLLVSH